MPSASMVDRARLALGLGLMLMSGWAALGYQMVWTQQCALWLGHESAAVLAVVSAFFGGLALGAGVLGARIERMAQPLRAYAACEAVIAAWAVMLWAVMPHASAGLLTLIGPEPSAMRQWAVAFGGCFVLLMPATVAMGATLPAMDRVLSGWLETARVGSSDFEQASSTRLAALYAANTAGAVLGVLTVSLWAIPAWGLGWTALLCAGLNGACALIAWLRQREATSWPPSLADGPGVPTCASASAGRRAVAWRLAWTGLLGIGHEVLVVRVLSQVAEDTVYTFAVLLAVYLLGTSLGAALYPRLARAWGRQNASSPDGEATDTVGDRLLQVLAWSCLFSAMTLWQADGLLHILQQAWGSGLWGAVAAEAGVALAAFGLPTVAMGLVFCHLSGRARAAGLGWGRALSVNTLGATVAPPLFGVWMAPALGPKVALLGLVPAYAALSSPVARRRVATWLVAMAAVGLAVLAPPLAFVDVPDGGRILAYREGAMGAVSVVEDAEQVARLRINNRQQEGSSATLEVDGRQALLPMLWHPAPHRALFLGLGTGVTSGMAAEEAGVQVDAVELLPEVIGVSDHFRQVLDRQAPNPQLHVIAADARRWVRVTRTRYDVIVADNFQPARSGSGALYTVDHFRAVQSRLAPGGLFCQWLPLHQMDLPTLRSIVRAYQAVFPQAVAILASNSLETPVVGLVGQADPRAKLDLDRLDQRLATQRFGRSLAPFGLADRWAVAGSVIAGPAALQHLAQGAPLNTDDHPVVAYLAPRITYVPDSRPAERLLALLNEVGAQPDEVLAAADVATQARLAAYWQARNRFLVVGQGVRPASQVADMLAQVREPLLSVLAISADFRPAYDPLVGMAMALAPQDPASAHSLLQRLQQVQPRWADATEALSQL